MSTANKTKRGAPGASEDTPNKRTTQSSLLGWAKPKPVAGATVAVPAAAPVLASSSSSMSSSVSKTVVATETKNADARQKVLPMTSVTRAPTPKRVDILSTVGATDRPLLQLEQDTMDPSWQHHLKAEFSKPYFISLKKFLQAEDAAKQQVFPPKEDIYSWSRFTPFNTVKVVILGQDPYHDDNQAHGLCFSVKKPVRPPPSLKNMFKLLEQDIPGFQIPSHGYLETWARQGVLMINSSMTVQAHRANSHKGKGWEKLLDEIVKTINNQSSNVVFMLWGADAQKRGAFINKAKHLVLSSVHPSPLSAHRGFFDCAHFSKANAYLGDRAINWNSLIEDSS